VHFEPWFADGSAPSAGHLDRDETLAGLAEALSSLAGFVAADEVTIGRVAPRRLRAPLARRLRDMAGVAGSPPRSSEGVAEHPRER
jgi:hypothetical protein